MRYLGFWLSKGGRLYYCAVIQSFTFHGTISYTAKWNWAAMFLTNVFDPGYSVQKTLNNAISFIPTTPTINLGRCIMDRRWDSVLLCQHPWLQFFLLFTFQTPETSEKSDRMTYKTKQNSLLLEKRNHIENCWQKRIFWHHLLGSASLITPLQMTVSRKALCRVGSVATGFGRSVSTAQPGECCNLVVLC